MRRVKCELCGTEFDCGEGLGCWCATVKVSSAKRKEIASLAVDCVCRDCLVKGAKRV